MKTPTINGGASMPDSSPEMLKVDDLAKSYPQLQGKARVQALHGISFRVGRGEMFTLLGPSGCGKSTTLRCVAGLEVADEGRIVVGDEVFFSASEGRNLPPESRGLGMVFQSYAVWPHMSVYDNVAFPLTIVPRRLRPSAAEVRERVSRVLRTMRLEDMADRPAPYLSGGQQQRLALARALVVEPPLLLLDEPLSNLDAALREEMWVELKRLQQDLAITAVYVTHDQIEALAMSDVIAVMNRGIIEQVGVPSDLYELPRSEFVARFIGRSNLIPGQVSRLDIASESVVVETDIGRMVSRYVEPPAVGDAVYVVCKRESVRISSAGEATAKVDGVNIYHGHRESDVYLGEAIDYNLRVGNTVVGARRPRGEAIGEVRDVAVTMPADCCVAVPRAGSEGGPQAGRSDAALGEIRSGVSAALQG